MTLGKAAEQFLECAYSQLIIFPAAEGMFSVLNRASGSPQHSTLLQGIRLRESERRSQKFRILVFSTVLEHTTGPQCIIVDLMNEHNI